MRRQLTLTFLLLACVLTSCADRPVNYRAEPWQEADGLFRRDPHWLGGDGGYSVDLGNGRVLWLFADSFVDPSGSGIRSGAAVTMIGNTVAIQHGYDPSKAEIDFYWKTTAAGEASAFFADTNDDRYWPGNALLLDDRLIIFLMRVKRVSAGLGFEVYDWDAVLVENPADDPDEWQLLWLDGPDSEKHIAVGSAGILHDNGFVYAFGSQEPGGKLAYLARWPADSLYKGTLAGTEWLGQSGWTSRESGSQPVFLDAQTEFTVHFDRQAERYVQIQTVGFGPAVIAVRTAPSLTGPWTEPVSIYQPPEFGRPRVMIYQGKAHPYLAGADFVLTYSTNSSDFADLLNDDAIYFPRFVRVSRN